MRRWIRGGTAAVPSVLSATAMSAALLVPPSAFAQSLRGSPGTVDRQHSAAVEHDFTFLRDAAHVQRFVEAGYLVPVHSNHVYRVKRISFPYARPEVQLFLSRLGSQYNDACGETLVVTSLTRPTTRQPWNASKRSVHPTGMAVDLRRSTSRHCREWLESVLLHLEERGVVEAVRESRPPHYHVAVFPRQYSAYVALLEERGGEERTTLARESRYRVRPGDTLWTIARNTGTTVPDLRAANDLRGNRIFPGQLLRVGSTEEQMGM